MKRASDEDSRPDQTSRDEGNQHRPTNDHEGMTKEKEVGNTGGRSTRKKLQDDSKTTGAG